MIQYSIPKPHPLCGHFIKANTQNDIRQVAEIAEDLGFQIISEGKRFQSHALCFMNDGTCKFYHKDYMSGQEITLDELKTIAKQVRTPSRGETNK